MGKYIYLNNFPREKALKGSEFKGNSELEKELLERGIISVGKPTVESNIKATEDAETIAKLQAKATEDAEIITDLKLLVEEAVGLTKGTYPDGFKKYQE